MQRAFQAERRATRIAGLIPQIVIFGAVATVATGLAIRAAGGHLGTALPPFVSPWAPKAGPLTAVTLVVLAAACVAAPRLAERIRSPLGFAATLFALALALGLALNLTRLGTRGWYSIFDTGPHGSFEAKWEYLPGLSALSYGPHYFLDRFAELVPALPVNAAGHPPGLLLTLHLLGVGGPRGMAALCIGAGALTAPLAYDLGRTLGSEQRGRAAGLLTAFAPSLLLFGVTSADYLYAALGMAAACLLVRERRLAGAALLALAAFFSWLLLAIAAWAAVVVGIRHGLRRAALLAAACAAAVLALNGVLALWTGYDPLGALRSTGAVYRNSLAAVRPYDFWAFGSPSAWLFMLGLPTAWFALRALAMRDPAALALAAVVGVSALLGFTKAETERIWLPFVPLAAVAAAGAIGPRRLEPVLWGLAAQALVIQLLFYTIW